MPSSTHWMVRTALVGGLALAMVGLAACGDDPQDRSADISSPSATKSSEPILIKTRVSFQEPVTGTVLKGSSIGGTPFCSGGTFRDQHGNDQIGLVDRTFRCPDGTLRIGFTPGAPQGRTQSGPWKILSGTGAFEGMQGSGAMKTTYDAGDDKNGSEEFTGTIAR